MKKKQLHKKYGIVLRGHEAENEMVRKAVKIWQRVFKKKEFIEGAAIDRVNHIIKAVEKGNSFTLSGSYGKEKFRIYTVKPVYLEREDRLNKGCNLSSEQVAVFNGLYEAKITADLKRFENCKLIFKKNYPTEYEILLLADYKIETESQIYYQA
jgi:hypothetical protein